MNSNNALTKRLHRGLSLCVATLALAFAAAKVQALELSGLIKVNGAEMPGVLLGVYECAGGTFIGATHTGPTDSSSGVPKNFIFSAPFDDVRIELYYSETPDQTPLADQCRDFVLCGQIIPVDGKAIVNVDMTCEAPIPPVQPGVAGPGYWKNHPSAWPVDEITIGGRTYPKRMAILLMSLPEKGDKTKTVFRHLVAAKLNVLVGNDDSCIAEAIEAADAWLARHPVCSGVRASSLPWRRIAPVVTRLDAYNSGLLCAPPREENDSGDRDDHGRGRD